MTETSIRELRRRARRGNTTAIAELAARGITIRRGSVAAGRDLHRQRHAPPAT